MPTTPDQSWINVFTADIQARYEDTGWFLPTLCAPAAVDGANLYWHQIGKVDDAMSTARKARYSLHTLSGLEHGMVSISTTENELPLAIERLDLIKTNIDYRQTYASRMLDAMGRVVDAKGITAFNAGKNATILGPAPFGGTLAAADDLDVTYVQQARETFDDNYIPKNDRYWLVDSGTWSLLERMPEFSNADYIGYDMLPFKTPMPSKPFQGFNVIQWPALPKVKDDGSAWVDGVDAAGLHTGTRARTMMFQRDCFGYGESLGLESRITYENLVSAWVIVMQMSNGFHIVDDTGVFEFTVDTLAKGVNVPQFPGTF